MNVTFDLYIVALEDRQLIFRQGQRHIVDTKASDYMKWAMQCDIYLFFLAYE